MVRDVYAPLLDFHFLSLEHNRKVGETVEGGDTIKSELNSNMSKFENQIVHAIQQVLYRA